MAETIPDSGGSTLTIAPYELTPERQQKICQYISKGMQQGPAARCSGISRQTMRNWMATGEVEPNSPCGKFRKAVLEAEAQHQYSILQNVNKHATEGSDYRAGIALLERRHKEDWQAPTQKTEISGPGGGPIQIDSSDLECLSEEELTLHLMLMEKISTARTIKAEQTTKLLGDGSE